MKIRFVHHAVAVLACIGMLMPQGALAASPTPDVMGRDIALRDGGLFVGQVVDAQGKPMAASEVSVRFGKEEIVRTKTDKNGVFAAKGLRGGEYTVVAGGGQVSYRLWAPETAPPVACKGALIVTGDAIVNGQCNTCPPGYGGACGPACDTGAGGGILGFVKSHPILVASGIAAAIAIPLAIADDDDPTS